MINENYVKLDKSSIQGVPFDLYEKDFTFVVNGDAYPTNRLIADILSPKICQLHMIDPTLDQFIINTQTIGNFSKFFDLINFRSNYISEDDFEFFSEIIKILNIHSIRVYIKEEEEQTLNSSIQKIQKYERNRLFYHTMLEKETKFVALHFSELSDEQECKLKKLNKSSIVEIISNSNLRLKNEDQLLNFIRELCMNDSECFFMYEYVQFVNVTVESMANFLREFNYNDLTFPIWASFSERLLREIVKNGNESSNEVRYVESQLKSVGTKIEFKGNNELDGIMRHIVINTNGKLEDELEITASSIGNSSYPLKNLLNDHPNQYFYTRDNDRMWICFDFKMHEIIPTHYTIKTNLGGNNVRSWRIEGSSDKISWEVLDQQKNCGHTHGDNKVHTFKICNQQNHKFRYLRAFSTGVRWSNDNCFLFGAIDFYGTLL